ncbi:MAG: hypothetical protein SFV15_03980 [Polyangiaceae bacterium]|nr:hypothetical protein [Polyangiaceae bacterium]
MAKAAALAVTFAALLSFGCITPPPASERATDAARQLNVAARFGRMDVALETTAPSFRAEFLRRHAQWGEGVRVLDVELAGLQMKDSSNAKINVDVSWAPANSSLLQRTRLEQTWSDLGRGFVLVRERRIAGAIGLFGEGQAVLPEPHPDVHFPTRTLR